MDSGLFGGGDLPPWLKGKFGAARGKGTAGGRGAGTVGTGVGVGGAREGASGAVGEAGGTGTGSGCGEAGKVPRSGNGTVAGGGLGGAFSAADLERTRELSEVAYYPLLSGGGRAVRVGDLGLEDGGGGGVGGVDTGNVAGLVGRLDLWMRGIAVDIGKSVLGEVYLEDGGVLENFAVPIVVVNNLSFFEATEIMGGEKPEKEFAILHFRAESGWWVSTKVESIFGLLNCELHIDNYLIYLKQLIYRAYSA